MLESYGQEPGASPADGSPRALECIRPAADAFLMQIGCASCSPVRVIRILHPADPPSYRNQGTPHDLPKVGVAGSNPVRRSERSPGFARLRSRGFFLVVYRVGVMQ